jgi:hypothetical protein
LRLRKRFFSRVFTIRKIPLLGLLAEPLALSNAEVARELGDSPGGFQRGTAAQDITCFI